MSLRNRLESFYQTLTLESLNEISSLYHESVKFRDPVSSFYGINAVTHYFEGLLASTRQCTFDLKRVDQTDDYVYVTWTMTVAHPKINKNEPYQVEGISTVQVQDDKIIFQRDYYDMGELMYEKLPVLKQVIRFIKRQMDS